jgi:serine/threonine protein kinase
MALSVGQRIGSYEVISQLGAGGMGEVYRARDSKLKREAAIKVLPADVADDGERLARFQREAEVLASLNHPNIAQVYGFGDGPAEAGPHKISFLVMELVEGEDLSQRIARGRVPTDEALAIAKQIAEALEAAHDAGIVHRDLKPGNVKVREDGTVKVLDFGLAKPQDLTPGAQNLSNSPTITSPAMTMRGVILGTAAYMSPEQAKGKAVDRRADIWAFGCVLYEMLTGKRAFQGEDATDTIAEVLKSSVDWTALPEQTPSSIRVLLRRCLEKDPRKRAAHISIARLAIEDATTVTDQLMAPPPQPRRTISVVAASIIAVALIGAASIGYWVAYRPAETVSAPVLRSTLIVTENLNPRAPSNRFAVSPDGRKLAYIAADSAGGRIRLWVRSLEGRAGVSLPGTDGAAGPFWSPDSQFIAFYTGNQLKKIAASGGEPVTITTGIAASGMPGSWSREDVIVFNNAATLARVPASGGTPQPITTLAADQLETSHDYPFFLPDGKHLLYSAFRDMRAIGTFVIPLEGGAAVKLVESSLNAQFASGYLIYAIDAAVMAQPFDPATRQLTGTPSAIAETVLSNVTQKPGSGFSVSQAGTLVHQSTFDMDRGARLVYSTRAGARTPILDPAAANHGLAVSPDGQHLAMAPLDGRSQSDIWILNLARGSRVRLTTTNNSYGPIWKPDSRSVVFATGNSFFTQAINGGIELRLPGTDPGGQPLSLAADGRTVLFERIPGDIYSMAVDGSTPPTPLLATRASERWAQYSPDGRWIAYTSDESSARQVYVKRNNASAERWQVSLGGGNYPRWSRDGRELFFWDPATVKMAAAKLTITPAGVEVERIDQLFEVRPPDGFARYFYDVLPDGRFVMEVAPQAAYETKLVLTANWPELLKPTP